MTRPVFFSEDEALATCAPGEALTLGGSEGHHAAAVKRIEVGEGLDLVDGCGVRVTCEVSAASSAGVDLRVLSVEREQEPRPRLILVQALAKGGRDEHAIEMCTEIGVDGVVPWQSDRAIVRWAGPKKAKAHDKWRAVMRAAAKQARRAFIPSLADVCDTKALVRLVSEARARGAVVLLCHEEATLPLTQLLATMRADLVGAPEVYVLVGPEGGVSPQETADLVGAGAIAVGLGRNILRSSTAGALCLTLLAAAVERI